uniref:CARD domain-containing protein n=1 Tax=Plectus sambesii TaxID=2011161 RepID=A0A914VKD5_9BILA
MDKQKQKAIERHNAALIDSMDPLTVMDRLCADIISSAEKECIKESSSIRRDRNRELIATLFRKQEELEPFESFVEALKEIDASHQILAEAILKAYKYDNGATEFEKVPKMSPSDVGETKYDLQK